MEAGLVLGGGRWVWQPGPMGAGLEAMSAEAWVYGKRPDAGVCWEPGATGVGLEPGSVGPCLVQGEVKSLNLQESIWTLGPQWLAWYWWEPGAARHSLLSPSPMGRASLHSGLPRPEGGVTGYCKTVLPILFNVIFSYFCAPPTCNHLLHGILSLVKVLSHVDSCSNWCFWERSAGNPYTFILLMSLLRILKSFNNFRFRKCIVRFQIVKVQVTLYKKKNDLSA